MMSEQSLDVTTEDEDQAFPSSQSEKLEEKCVDEKIERRVPGDSISVASQTDSPPLQPTAISFPPGDPANPYNFSRWRKVFIVLVGVALTMNSTIGSSIASGTSDEISQYFHNYNEEQLVLPTSIYLVGYVLGPLLWGPLSETFGRKPVMILTFTLYTAFTLGCALAPTFAALIVFRLLVGMGASSPISVVGGIYADIYDDPTTRGRAMSAFMTATMFGPLLGPVLGGFIGVVSWRWSFWLALLIAAATWPVLLWSPETYGPVILKHRAQRLRKETGDCSILAPLEIEGTGLVHVMTTVLTRPLRMLCQEAIVLCSCLYLAYAYGIFYMFFQAYPLIYRGVYGFNAGEEGLAFLPIGIGAVFACIVYLWWDKILQDAKARDAAWSHREEYRRLPLACMGGPLFVISLFWVGWTAKSSVHWIVPMLAGITWGLAFMLIFMSLLNYMIDAYETFAASATAAGSFSRSIFGAVLPFSSGPMFKSLGIPWACSLLGFISLALCVIPFAFIKYGDQIRARSKFCQYLKAMKEEKRRESDAAAATAATAARRGSLASDGESRQGAPEMMV